VCFLVFIAGLAMTAVRLAPVACAQGARASTGVQAGSSNADPTSQNQAQVLLRERMERVEKAKSAGNPAEVGHASELVIALALRELGQIRLLESAYGQAAELYARSLDFENLPDTRIDLAIAYLSSGQFDRAIAEADQALLDDPNGARAFQVLGRAWTMKNDYPRAAHAFVRVAEISPTLENIYMSATAFLATKNADDRERAEQAFAQMTKMAGDSGSLHVVFGRAYRDAGDYGAAIREFERAIQLDTRTPHAHYFLGLAHLAANEWVPAPVVRAEFLMELEFYPRDYLANYMMGFIDSSERKYEQSNRYLKVATSLKPEAPDPWFYLGLNAYSQNDMKRAEMCFRKAIQFTGTDYGHANYLIRRAYIDLGRILTSSGRKEEAEPYLAKARELQNKALQSSQQAMASRFVGEGADGASPAIVALGAEQDEPLGLSRAENADPFAQIEPDVMARANFTEEQKKQANAQEKQLRAVLAQSFSDLATSDAIRKQYAAAVRHYAEAEHWDPSYPGLMRNLGVAAFRAQNYPEAVRSLSGALAAKPEDAPVRAMLGMAYTAQDKYKEAVKTFTPLGKKGMEDAAAGYAWALSLTRLGELPKATEVLEEFQKGDRPNDMLMLVGQLWLEIADYARAAATFHQVLTKDPSYPKAHYFAGQACLRWQHWEEAAKEFQAELELVPGDLDAKFNLGFVYLQLSRPVDAEKLFQEVIAANPEHPNAQYEYGKILMERGEVENAISHLEIAARLSPQTDYVHYQLQAAYRKEGRIADADRELDIYKKIKANSRGRATAAISKQTP
jgi:tetratricopeptide (TPR) repeat protein